ncbi:SDR family NAD(P)-dependent oxidoreductase [Klebsiella pneumoniae]
MLRGKRAVITGGGTGFGQALSVWLAREGVEVDFCARRADDIQKTCSIITAEGGMAKGHLCDLTLPESLSQFSSQLLTLDKPIDILILNAAQWLSGTLDDQSDTEIINTISSGLTGSILLTQALLPGLRRSESADIVSIISSCGIPNFTDSIAHPAFFASKHGLSGFTTKEGANKQVISSQADSLIKISRIRPIFFPQTHRISLFRLFFPPFLALFPVFTEISPTDVSFGPPETGWPG